LKIAQPKPLENGYIVLRKYKVDQKNTKKMLLEVIVLIEISFEF